VYAVLCMMLLLGMSHVREYTGGTSSSKTQPPFPTSCTSP